MDQLGVEWLGAARLGKARNHIHGPVGLGAARLGKARI